MTTLTEGVQSDMNHNQGEQTNQSDEHMWIIRSMNIFWGSELPPYGDLRSAPVTRIVIDTNMAASQFLDDWLGASKLNIAVLPLAVMDELAAVGTVEKLIEKYQILSKYPRQVEIQKDFVKLSKLPPIKNGSARRLIDENLTIRFPDRCQQLAKDINNPEVRASLERHIHGAAAMLQELALQELHIEISNAFVDSFKATDIKSMRQGDPFKGFLGKFCEMVAHVSRNIFDNESPATRPKSVEELPYSFTYRVVLCLSLFLWIRTRDGDPAAAGVKRMRNDYMDSRIIASALYFNGFMSSDENSRTVFEEAHYILEILTFNGPLPDH